MLHTDGKLSAHDLVHELIPKLKATEDLINNTLQAIIEQTGSEEERSRRVLQQQEFELEITMIRMNLDHLLKRYAKEIQDVVDSGGDRPGAMLQLDQHERFAIESARQLYERARAIQTA